MDEQTRTEVEAAAFRRLRAHLLEGRPDVQNIALMGTAGFCRNCLARWMEEAAAERGVVLSKDEAREMFYGMPYGDWAVENQREATAAEEAAFRAAQAREAGKG